MSIPRFHRENTAILVIDVQEKLLPVIQDFQLIEKQILRLLDGALALQLPLLVTEQYRKGLGGSVPEVEKRIGAAALREEKMQFSACTTGVRKELSARHVGHVIVCGIEAHVCVLQTCLDLASSGLVTGVAVDAIGSRRPMDRDVAIERMIQAGIVPVTVESALFEMVQQAGTETFKAILPVVK